MGFVELTRDLPTETFEALVAGAYAASRHGRIALVLEDVPPTTVDRVLDPLVLAGGCDSCGVWYVDRASLHDGLLDLATGETFAIVASPELAERLDARGIGSLSIHEGLALFGGAAENASSLVRSTVTRRSSQRGSVATT